MKELPVLIRKTLSCLRQKPGNSLHRDLFSGLFVPFHISFEHVAFCNIKFCWHMEKVWNIEIIV